MPSYETLDQILSQILDQDLDDNNIANNLKIETAIVKNIRNLLHTNEFKRRQGPCIIRISNTQLGYDIKFPL